MAGLKQVGNVQLMQKINRNKVVNLIRGSGPIARPAIAQETGLSMSSVTNLVLYLMSQGLVKEVGTEDSGRVGRKAALLRFAPEAYQLVCVTLDPTAIYAALTDLDGNPHKAAAVRLNAMNREYALEILREEVRKLLEAGDRVRGIGVGAAGLVLEGTGKVWSSSLRWEETNIAQELALRPEIPVLVENISRTKAMYLARRQEGFGAENSVFVDLEMGIGMVQVCDGKVCPSVMGEIGHTTVERGGELCFCGNRGCLEAMCSPDRILRLARERLADGGCSVLRRILNGRDPKELNLQDIESAQFQGDRDVLEILRDCGEYLGIGLGNIINLFHPRQIVLSGEISEPIYQTAVSGARARAYRKFVDGLLLSRRTISAEESIQGVAAFVTDRLLDVSQA